MLLDSHALHLAIGGLTADGLGPEAIADSLLMAKMTKPERLLQCLLDHQRGAFDRRDAPPALASLAGAPAGPFVPSEIHLAIRDAVRAGSVQIVARAGTGKTATMVWLADDLIAQRPDERILALAFNKGIAQALAARMPEAVTCATLHALCWQVIQRARGWSRRFGASSPIDPKRLATRAAAVLCDAVDARRIAVPVDPAVTAQRLASLWSLSRATGTAVNEPAAINRAMTTVGTDADSEPFLPDLVADLDARLRQDRGTISFDEMLTVVIDEDLALPTFDTVLVDEAQDLNAVQIQLIARLGARRVVAVGDPRQAIYAWRGADQQAMDRLAATCGITVSLPLVETRRCPTSVVEEARHLVPDLRALPGAPQGSVMRRGSDQLVATACALAPGDFLLARTNATLVEVVLRLTQRRCPVPVRILGEPPADLDRLGGDTPATEAAARLAAQCALTVAKLEAAGRVEAAVQARDRADAAIAVLRQAETVGDAKDLIRSLFVREIDPLAVMAMTIHRSKGLEAATVVILDPQHIPLPRILASGNAALIGQEQNLLYVAITRARQRLVYQAI
jgi:hypothetical protein